MYSRNIDNLFDFIWFISNTHISQMDSQNVISRYIIVNNKKNISYINKYVN